MTPGADSLRVPRPSIPDQLDTEHNMNYVHVVFQWRERPMFRAVVEEAAVLASLALFIGMIAVWAQVIAFY